ncbi:MAG TPA: L,D-transpeptidase [Chthoniobacterales bacterium]
MTKTRRIEINVSRQRLDVFEDYKIVLSTPVSTAFRGLGCEPGSLKTPPGKFVVSEKIGAGEPEGMVFRSRIATGEMADARRSEDQITSRILWLDGVDPSNANTKGRYIYIHGTNDEARLGTPVSHGCIRLANTAIVDLFELAETGTPVTIR